MRIANQEHHRSCPSSHPPRDGAVVTITLDRVAEGNLLPVDGVRELTAAFRAAGASDAKVIVLRGNGADFCRGRDSQGWTALAHRDEDARQCVRADPRRLRRHGERAPADCRRGGRARRSGSKLRHRERVRHQRWRTTTRALQASREMEKDLPPTLAMSAVMPRVPRKVLAWMVYSMDELDAATARQVGIVSKVAPAAQVESEVAKLLATMTARMPGGARRRQGLPALGPAHGTARRRRLRRPTCSPRCFRCGRASEPSSLRGSRRSNPPPRPRAPEIASACLQ